jgi:hypothetical protein
VDDDGDDDNDNDYAFSPLPLLPKPTKKNPNFYIDLVFGIFLSTLFNKNSMLMLENSLDGSALTAHVLKLRRVLSRWRTEECWTKDDCEVGDAHRVYRLALLDPTSRTQEGR